MLRVLSDLEDLGEGDVLASALIEMCINQIPENPDTKRDKRRERVMGAIESLCIAGHLKIQNGSVIKCNA